MYLTECRNVMWYILLSILFMFVTAACGAAGFPIAPEEVGLEAKIRKQQRERQRSLAPNTQGEYVIPLEEESVELPPLHPVGVR